MEGMLFNWVKYWNLKMSSEEIRKDLNKLDNKVAEYTDNINGLMGELNELSGFATVDGEKVSRTSLDEDEYEARLYEMGVDKDKMEVPEGTLTDFQKERINRLMDAIDEYPVSNLDEKGQKILLQCVDEISTLVDAVA